MFGAYDMGYDEGKKDGFNEAILAAMQIVSQSPFLDSCLTEELYQEIRKLMKS